MPSNKTGLTYYTVPVSQVSVFAIHWEERCVLQMTMGQIVMVLRDSSRGAGQPQLSGMPEGLRSSQKLVTLEASRWGAGILLIWTLEFPSQAHFLSGMDKTCHLAHKPCFPMSPGQHAATYNSGAMKQRVRFQHNLRLPENAGLWIWYGTRGNDSFVSITALSSLSVAKDTLKIFQNWKFMNSVLWATGQVTTFYPAFNPMKISCSSNEANLNQKDYVPAFSSCHLNKDTTDT